MVDIAYQKEVERDTIQLIIATAPSLPRFNGAEYCVCLFGNHRRLGSLPVWCFPYAGILPITRGTLLGKNLGSDFLRTTLA